ncbi:hypothetical protein LDENG_00081350 [Lucifuga dentata]|nr:hypothetical protein LDENG_00081350 [Lucifuga dentata]
MAFTPSEEQFHCCICLDIFNSPVSIPCGHNFCLDCIVAFWDTRAKPVCPLCKEVFNYRPDLRTNQTFSKIVEYLRRSRQEEDGDNVLSPQTEEPAQTQGADPNNVSCDICCENNVTAVKSCLVCQASYCDTHLISHQRAPVLKRHWLVDPVTFATRDLCRNHKQPLVMFCKSDHSPLCMQCAGQGHKNHETIAMQKASRKIKTHFRETQSEVQQMIQTRLEKVEEIKNSVEISKKLTDWEMERSARVCSTLIKAVERIQAELVERLEERQKAAERRAEELLSELRQEINDMQRRNDELERLQHTDNHLHLLQSFVSLSMLPSPKDWTEVRVHTDNCTGTVRRAASKLMDMCKELEKKLSTEEVDRMNEYAADVTLDPVTASGWLVLSGDKKTVSLNFQQKRLSLPEDSRRFDSCVCVLGKQGFTRGRRYWVVQVGDKTEWDLGVAKASINRKGAITVRPECGYWAICRRKGGNLSACTGRSITLHLQKNPQKEGVVSFYDAEAKMHIYTYSECEFSEAIYPYFNPCVHDNGKNTAPLVICPV